MKYKTRVKLKFVPKSLIVQYVCLMSCNLLTNSIQPSFCDKRWEWAFKEGGGDLRCTHELQQPQLFSATRNDTRILDNWARIYKRLRSPEADSKESILPAYVSWRAGTSNRDVVPAHQSGNRFPSSLKGLKIRALDNDDWNTFVLSAPMFLAEPKPIFSVQKAESGLFVVGPFVHVSLLNCKNRSV